MAVFSDASSWLQNFWRLRLVRFAGGGLINLCSRLFLVFLFASLGLPLYVNYAVIHVLTFVFAFIYHSTVTFGVRISPSSLKRFLGSVLLVRALDYAFVIVATGSTQWLEWVSSVPRLGDLLGSHVLYINVLIASAASFVVRYLIFTRYTFTESLRGRRVDEHSE